MRIGPLSPYTVEAEVAALRPGAERDREVSAVVEEVLGDVKSRGDEAVVEASRRFEWPGAEAPSLRVTDAEIEESFHSQDPALIESLEVARDNLTWFHGHELRLGWEETGPAGQQLGIRYVPVRRAGLYVPGGLAAYPSSVIMNAVPARVAGVRDVFICTPPDRSGRVSPSILAAAHLMGIVEVYRVGGAQAVAAMAYGTESVPPADVVTGPGNAYVNEAKRQVYGKVGIDGLAGPSEVLILADGSADPVWVAADLLAQAEHGSGAIAVLVASSEDLCRSVEAAVDRMLAGVGEPATDTAADGLGELVARDTAADALVGYYPAAGESFDDVARAMCNSFAPEHLELHLADPGAYLDDVEAAGAVFVGGETPTAFGDYTAGTNHVLPTGGAARFSSPLSVDTFLRKMWTVELSPESIDRLSPHAERVADEEGFVFHALSARLRREGR